MSGNKDPNEEYNKSYRQTHMRDPHTGSPLPGHPDYKSSSNGSSSKCFAAGTLIWTARGNRPIEEVVMGDLVWSQNEAGAVVLKPVIRRFDHAPTRLWLIECDDGSVIRTTSNHSFRCAGHWRRAADLRIGDRIESRSPDASIRHKSITKSSHCSEVLPVYNLVVMDNFTFYAGGMLVHSFTRLRSLAIAYWNLVQAARKFFVRQTHLPLPAPPTA